MAACHVSPGPLYRAYLVAVAIPLGRRSRLEPSVRNLFERVCRKPSCEHVCRSRRFPTSSTTSLSSNHQHISPSVIRSITTSVHNFSVGPSEIDRALFPEKSPLMSNLEVAGQIPGYSHLWSNFCTRPGTLIDLVWWALQHPQKKSHPSGVREFYVIPFPPDEAPALSPGKSSRIKRKVHTPIETE